MKQKTSVQWLFDEFLKPENKSALGSLLLEAIEMEKEQTINFYNWMRFNEQNENYFHYSDLDMFSEYFKETEEEF
jgi:hypothetical protein